MSAPESAGPSPSPGAWDRSSAQTCGVSARNGSALVERADPHQALELAQVVCVAVAEQRVDELRRDPRLGARAVAPLEEALRQAGIRGGRGLEEVLQEQWDVLAPGSEAGHLHADRKARSEVVLERRDRAVRGRDEAEIRSTDAWLRG